MTDKESRTWASIIHFSQFAGYVFFIFGIIVPIILWLIKKDEHEFVNDQGKEVMNFLITQFIIGFIGGLLIFAAGIGIIILALFSIYCIIIIIVGGVKASQGERFRYPICIRFIK